MRHGSTPPVAAARAYMRLITVLVRLGKKSMIHHAGNLPLELGFKAFKGSLANGPDTKPIAFC